MLFALVTSSSMARGDGRGRSLLSALLTPAPRLRLLLLLCLQWKCALSYLTMFAYNRWFFGWVHPTDFKSRKTLRKY